MISMPLNSGENSVLRHEEDIMLSYRYLSDAKYALDTLETHELNHS